MLLMIALGAETHEEAFIVHEAPEGTNSHSNRNILLCSVGHTYIYIYIYIFSDAVP